MNVTTASPSSISTKICLTYSSQLNILLCLVFFNLDHFIQCVGLKKVQAYTIGGQISIGNSNSYINHILKEDFQNKMSNKSIFLFLLAYLAFIRADTKAFQFKFIYTKAMTKILEDL